MNKDPPRIQTREQWLAACKRLLPGKTPEQYDQLWQECQRFENVREPFYERSSNKTRFQ